MIEHVDRLIRTSLSTFVNTVQAMGWQGRREHEAKSLYAFGFLAPHCQPAGFLYNPAQIALDTPVCQIDHETQRELSGGTERSKQVVAKDLLIWPEPFMTCWRDGLPCVHPTVIMEWKLNKGDVDPYDVAWLRTFSEDRGDFVGYALDLDLRRTRASLRCTRVHQGEADTQWLTIS